MQELLAKNASKYEEYYNMLIERNKHVNLTAVTDYDGVYAKHFCDSLAIFLCDAANGANSVIDIGTGAGFPGMVMAIERPEISITLLDSLNKRLVFLDDVAKKLGLNNVKTVHGRAEDFAHDADFRQNFDLAVSRAVASLPSLCELCLPYVAVGGHFVAFKGPAVADELKSAENAVKLLGGKLSEVKNYEIPNTDLRHNLVIIKKILDTSPKYPRKMPKPIKNPLN